MHDIRVRKGKAISNDGFVKDEKERRVGEEILVVALNQCIPFGALPSSPFWYGGGVLVVDGAAGSLTTFGALSNHSCCNLLDSMAKALTRGSLRGPVVPLVRGEKSQVSLASKLRIFTSWRCGYRGRMSLKSLYLIQNFGSMALYLASVSAVHAAWLSPGL